MKYKEIQTLEDLRSSMCIPNDESEENIAMLFYDIAHFLINQCSIECYDNSSKKGKNHYRMTDIEFYYYSDNHRDIYTHPRNSNSLMWYINDFGGIDLNFQSVISPSITKDNNNKVSYKYNLKKASYFGGILIRQVENIETREILGGPWKVADLFRKLNALSAIQDSPILIMEEHEHTEIFELSRHNILGSKKKAIDKAEYNIKENYDVNCIDSEDLETVAEHFKTVKYRFTIYPNGKR